MYQCPSNFQNLCDQSGVVSSASREYFTTLFCYFFVFGRGGDLGVQFTIKRYINTASLNIFSFFLAMTLSGICLITHLRL